MAKINLGLDVVRRREDGYHEVRMIMQTIRMYDTLELTATEEPGIRVKTNLKYLPVNEELMERGVKIGADVPYCILRGTALAEGIGEKLTPLTPAPDCHVLIAKPPISVSTKFVYENLHLDQLEAHPDIDGIRRAIEEGDLCGMVSRMGNVLETVTIPAYPQIGQISELMKENGALGAMMSGSGPTVFGIYDDERKAMAARDVLKKSDLAQVVYLTKLFQSGGTKE